MWKTLGNLRETVKEGLQEFSRDALKETTLIRSSVVENVVPVTKSLANADILGRRFRERGLGSYRSEEEYSQARASADQALVELQPGVASVSTTAAKDHGGILEVSVPNNNSEDSQEAEEGWEGQLTPVIPITPEAGDGEGEGWDVDASTPSPVVPATGFGRDQPSHASETLSVPASSLQNSDSIQRLAGNGAGTGSGTNETGRASLDVSLEESTSGRLHSISLEDEVGTAPVILSDDQRTEPKDYNKPRSVSLEDVVHNGADDTADSGSPGKPSAAEGDVPGYTLTPPAKAESSALTPSSSIETAGEEAVTTSDNLNANQEQGSEASEVKDIIDESMEQSPANVQAKAPELDKERSAHGEGLNVSEKITAISAIKEQELKEAREKSRKDAAAIERLDALCTQLRDSLEEALSDRSNLAEQLSKMEDELEEARAEGARLDAEVQELEAATVEAAKMAEEEMQAAQNDYQKLQDRVHAAEAKAKQHEKEAATVKREREALEQRVKGITSSLEKRMASLTEEVQARQKEVDELREENDGMEKAFDELRALLKESVDERDVLVETLAEREKMVEEFRLDAERAEEELEAAKREAGETSVALAEAAAEVRALREAARGNESGADERQHLEVSLKAAEAAHQAAAAEAAEWKEKSQQAEKEVKAKGKALAQAEADLALAHQRALAAEADADEAKRLRAEAEGTSEQLREQTERRAKVFNAAVKAAVSKIQTELESERDEALQQITVLESDAVAHAAELQNIQEHVSSLMEELDSANAAAATGEEEQARLQKEIGALEKQLAAAEERGREATKQVEAAKAASKKLIGEVKVLEARCAELQEKAESAQEKASRRVADVEGEREQAKELLASAERENTSLKISALETSAKVGEEASALRARIAELESQVGLTENRALRKTEAARQQLLEASGSPSKAKGRGGGIERQISALEDLGLDKVREERLVKRERFVASDVESAGEQKGRRGYRKDANLGWNRTAADEDRVSGRISRRSFIIGVYIVLLHIMVMVSFTQRSNPCPDSTSADRTMALPGL